MAPFLATPPVISLCQAIEATPMYHPNMVNANLPARRKGGNPHLRTDACRFDDRAGCGADSAVLTEIRSPAVAGELAPRPVRMLRLHEVDARMKPQNAHRPLHEGAAGA